MRMVAKRWGIASLLLCAAGLIAWVAIRTDDGARQPDALSGDLSDGDDPGAAAGAATSKTSRTSSSLASTAGAGERPAVRSSLSREESFRSILQRAEAGESRARCEVASVVLNCEGAVKHAQDLRRTRELHTQRVRALPASDPLRVESERWLGNSRTKGDPVYIAFTHCKEPHLPSRVQVLRMLRESALAGDPVAVEVYLSGKLLRDADPAELRQERLLYEAHAEEIARRAMARGSIVAALLLVDGYAQPDDAGANLNLSLLPLVVKQDLVKAYSHLHALRNAPAAQPRERSWGRLMAFADKMASAFEAALPPEDIARAKADAPTMPRHLGVRKLEASLKVVSRKAGINPRDCR